MTDTILASIIAGSLGLGGAILGVFIGWLLNEQTIDRTVKKQEFAKAAISFRLAFLELLLLLKENIKPKEFTDFPSYLVAMYHEHAAAIITFTACLDKAGIERINKAWFHYKFPNGIAKDEEDKKAFPLEDYAHMPKGKAERVALEKIENLLSVGNHVF